MRSDDTIRLKHMLDASKEAINLSAEKTQAEIEKERLLNLGLVRLLAEFHRRGFLNTAASPGYR